MRALALIIALVATTVSAQSILPACQGAVESRWNNCTETSIDPFNKNDTYTGEFRNGLAHGVGTRIFPNGDIYIGEMKKGLFDGIGTLTQVDGSKYIGDFKDGFRDGYGIEYKTDGSVIASGLFTKGKPNTPYLLAQQPLATNPIQSPTLAPRATAITPSTLALSVNASSPNSNGVVTLNITTNTDTASLKINGEEAGGRVDGQYAVQRFAQIGSNNFEVIATDRYGNTKKQTVVVNREVQVVAERTRSLNPTLISAAKSRDAVAIIIGIEKYRRVPDADFANNDVNAFYDYARRALGIKPENIRLLVDDKADASDILRAFNSWLSTRVKKDTTDVYVFYSGHGLPSEDGGSLYFLPHEVDRDLLERTAITQKEAVQTIQRTNPKSVTMFIDSCYIGHGRIGETLLANARPISIAPKASTDFPSNFMVISASAPVQIFSSSPEI